MFVFFDRIEREIPSQTVDKGAKGGEVRGNVPPSVGTHNLLDCTQVVQIERFRLLSRDLSRAPEFPSAMANSLVNVQFVKKVVNGRRVNAQLTVQLLLEFLNFCQVPLICGDVNALIGKEGGAVVLSKVVDPTSRFEILIISSLLSEISRAKMDRGELSRRSKVLQNRQSSVKELLLKVRAVFDDVNHLIVGVLVLEPKECVI